MVDRYISSPDNKHRTPFNCKKKKDIKFASNSYSIPWKWSWLWMSCFVFHVIPSSPPGCLLGNQRRLFSPRDSWLDYKWVRMHSHSSISQDFSVHRWEHHVHPCYILFKNLNRMITIYTKKWNTMVTTRVFFAVFNYAITRIASVQEKANYR